MENTLMEILLVEDKRSDAEMTIRALRKKNITNHILHLKDGKSALDFLFGTGEYAGRDTNIKPKIIIMDLKMPKVNGDEVLLKIKNHELTKNIPTVMFTSSRENSDIEKCHVLGVNSYVVKPVAFDDFMDVVADIGSYWITHNRIPA
jgi:two-component system response regulator